MKRIVKWIFLVAVLMGSAPLSAELLPYPTDTVEGQIIYRYRVPRSIGIYRISVNLGVTQAEIIQWNPQLRDRGLHYDEELLIPSHQMVEKTAEPAPLVVKDTILVRDTIPVHDTVLVHDTILVHDTLALVDSIQVDNISADTLRTLKIAVLLPFQANLQQRENTSDRFVEFYEGVLLALSELQTQYKFELFVHDIGKTEEKLEQLIADSALYNVDGIIGPAYPAQVEVISRLALADSTPTLIPFTDKIRNIATNPFLIQFNPDVKNEAKALADYLEDIQDKVNVVFIDTKEADIPYSIREFRQAVRNRGISVTRISVREILSDSLHKALKDSMENIIIFNSEKFSNLQLLLPHAINGKNGKQLTMYSRYSWQKEKILLPQIYTSVFAAAENNSEERAAALAEYESQFALYFKHEHGTDLPRFDLLGYDVTRQLVQLITSHSSLPRPYMGLQSDIELEKVNENGGYTNTKITVIRK